MSSSIILRDYDKGIKKSIDNAVRYLNDALFLFKHKRHQSSILLSMLSYEESGKALLLNDYKIKKKNITKTQWIKKFCSHTVKNLVSRRKIWEDSDFIPSFPHEGKSLARFDQEWKQVFTYVDYDYRNDKWTTPLDPTSFGLRNAESFCKSAMSNAAKALEAVMNRIKI